MSWTPGTLPAGFTPAEVWRNSGQVKLYLGGTVPEVVWQAPPDTRLEVPGRPAAALHKAAGSSRSTEVVAGEAGRILMTLERSCTGAEQLGGTGPQLWSPVRGWQRAGDGPATAARPSPAAASPGRFEGMTSAP